MSWWERNNIRMIQNNLRETDADMDVDLLLDQIQDLGANALMLNTGGVMAFYPSELEFQYQSPYLKHDIIGEAVTKCHARGIRFFARFDLSKVHESIFPLHPEWFYKSIKGESINYNNMVHTCLNSYYQQEYSLKIINEVLERYPIDGIFFNMFGYTTKDYSNNYHGICQCENCQTRFKEMYGLELPIQEDSNDPVFRKYEEFKVLTVQKLLENIKALVDSKQRDIAISTYTDYCVDIIRKESNTEIHQPYPLWQYSASENVKSVEDTWENKLISNISINAVGLVYRFMGVSEHRTTVRLYENIASGSGLDYCIIGIFDGYPDRETFAAVRKVYTFHRDFEQYFGRFSTLADILLIKPDKYTGKEQEMEYLGIFKMLKEEHVIFDASLQKMMISKLEGSHQYKVIIVPDLARFDKDQLAALRMAVRQGSALVATNLSFTDIPEDDVFLAELFGVRHLIKEKGTRGGYLDASEGREVFKSYPNRDWAIIDGNLSRVEFEKDTKSYLRYIAPGRFGPPERCGGSRPTNHFAAGIKPHGQSAGVYIPWQPGFLYQKYGYEAHKRLFMDLVDHVLAGRSVLETDAPLNVEVFYSRYAESAPDGSIVKQDGRMLQLINLSGYNGMTFFKPNRIVNIRIRLKGIGEVKKIYSIQRKACNAFQAEGDDVVLELDSLDEYDALLIE